MVAHFGNSERAIMWRATLSHQYLSAYHSNEVRAKHYI